MKKISALLAALAVMAALSGCGTLDSSGPHAYTKKDQHSKSAKAASNLTTAQKSAITSAQNYLSFSGFSRVGLIQQLSSKAGDGFKVKDAVFAVDHVKVDWNKEAVQSAKQYLQINGFSRAGLIQQLSSKAGDGYTHAQAVYAANHVGL